MNSQGQRVKSEKATRFQPAWMLRALMNAAAKLGLAPSDVRVKQIVCQPHQAQRGADSRGDCRAEGGTIMKCGTCGLDVAYRQDTGHKERNVIICPNCRTVKMWKVEYQVQQERQAEKDNQALDAMRRDIEAREGKRAKRGKLVPGIGR